MGFQTSVHESFRICSKAHIALHRSPKAGIPERNSFRIRNVKSHRVLRLTTLAVFALAPTWSGEKPAVAQQMEHSAPSIPSTRLTIHTYDGKTLTLSPDELAAMPHKSVAVFNAHSNANETYSGVPLAELVAHALRLISQQAVRPRAQSMCH